MHVPTPRSAVVGFDTISGLVQLLRRPRVILFVTGNVPDRPSRQESAMSLQERPSSPFLPWIPAISATPRSFLAAILSVACILSLTVELPASAAIPAAAKDKKHKTDPALKGLPITELSADEAILHALNRLAYGPRPGDVERVRQMGLARWIEQQ